MIADACAPLGDFLVISTAAYRVATLLLAVGLVGLVMYTIDAVITRDPGPPPRGKL